MVNVFTSSFMDFLEIVILRNKAKIGQDRQSSNRWFIGSLVRKLPFPFWKYAISIFYWIISFISRSNGRLAVPESGLSTSWIASLRDFKFGSNNISKRKSSRNLKDGNAHGDKSNSSSNSSLINESLKDSFVFQSENPKNDHSKDTSIIKSKIDASKIYQHSPNIQLKNFRFKSTTNVNSDSNPKSTRVNIVNSTPANSLNATSIFQTPVSGMRDFANNNIKGSGVNLRPRDGRKKLNTTANFNDAVSKSSNNSISAR